MFYAISMALVLSLFLGLVSGVTRNGCKLKAECAVDTALTSEFAEYCIPLWRDFGLIFVDCAYGESKGGIENAEKHLKGCLNENFSEDYLKLWGGADLYGLKVDECKISGIRFATDDKALPLAEQIVELMNYRYGLGYANELLSFATSVDKYEIDPSEYIDKANDANRQLTGQYDIHDYQGWVNTVSVGVNDSDGYSVSSFSILRKIMADADSLSKANIPYSSYVSQRQINSGNLSTDFQLSFTDRLLIKQYYFEFLSSFLYPKENSKLSYQSEFLLFGKNNDIQNIELAAKRIMFIRLAADIASLLSDGERMEKIRAVSEIVASLFGFPEAAILIETVIVAGWSYWESLADMKLIFAGKKVPFYKGHSQWITGLSGIFPGKDSDSNDEGLSYRDYIRIFLFLSDYETLMSRFMTIVETDIRNESGYETFRIDNCFDYIESDISVESKKGYFFEFNRRRGLSHK